MTHLSKARFLTPVIALCLVVLPGCMGKMPGDPDIIKGKAQYTDLANRSVAVIVSTRDYTEFNHPGARETITREVTRRIAIGVPSVKMSNPDQTLEWQDKNPYWATRPPSALIRQLGVDRLVLVEIGDYRLHEPGDKYLLRGVISASVQVVEAEAADPDNFAASYSKTVMYPRVKDSILGRAAADAQQIEMYTQLWFCEEVAGLFFDHELVR